MLDKIKVYAKAAAAFLTTLAGFCAALVADPNIRSIFPSNWLAVLSAIAGAGVVAGVVAGIPNKLTPAQVAKSGLAVGKVIVPEIAVQASNAAQDAVAAATKDIPIAGPIVGDISRQVGSVVDQVIRDFQKRL